MATTTQSFSHVTDDFTRTALSADPGKLSPETIERLASNTLDAANADLLDPDVPNALDRSFIAIDASLEPDPVKAHGLICGFWSI